MDVLARRGVHAAREAQPQHQRQHQHHPGVRQRRHQAEDDRVGRRAALAKDTVLVTVSDGCDV